MFNLFKQKPSSAEIFAKQVISEISNMGAQKADEIMEKNKAEMLAQCFAEPDLADTLSAQSEGFILSIEIQFLWGFFHEYVQTYKAPANGYDRILIHLIERLTGVHGFKFSDAVEFVHNIQDLYNKDDPFFSDISDLGKLAYHDGGDHYYTYIIKLIQALAHVKNEQTT